LQIIPFYTLQFNALNADCFQVNVNPSMACESEADREVSSPFEVVHSQWLMRLQVKLQLLVDTLKAASSPGRCPASFEQLV